jgi:predicted ATP-dependent serine protease
MLVNPTIPTDTWGLHMYECTECGREYEDYSDNCIFCGAYGSLKEVKVYPTIPSTSTKYVEGMSHSNIKVTEEK